MPYRNRIQFLNEAHRALDKQITTLEQSNSNAKLISELKKKKLAFKDEISRLTRQQYEADQTVHWDDE